MAHDLKRTGRRRTILPPPLPFCSLVSVFFVIVVSVSCTVSRRTIFFRQKQSFFKTMFTIYSSHLFFPSLSSPILPFVPRGPWSPFELHGRRNRAGDRRGREAKLFRNWNRLMLSPDVESALWGFEGGGIYGNGPSSSPSLVLSTRSLANIFISFLSPEQHLSSKKALPV